MASAANDGKDWTKADEGFEKFKRKNPGATHADYYARRMRKRVASGHSHATLGGKLKRAEGEKVAFAEGGRTNFESFHKMMKLEPRHRLIDYGCGSFRIGLHAMNYLDPGNYFGLDVVADFIDIGRELVGAETLAARKPRSAVITPESLAEAEAFRADAVMSIAVAIHVHPDETQTYYRNLARLASKPGAVLFFTVHLAERFERVGRMGFAWPLQFYKDQLPDLEFVGESDERLLFRRPR
jgi:cyclopropane fatty-acyl-phospholipid synthase-like methyltransferase